MALANVIPSDGPSIYVSAAYTISASQSGSTIIFTPGAAFTITLPSVQAGLNYKIVRSAATANLVRIDSGGANLMNGGIIGGAAVTQLGPNRYMDFTAANGTVRDFAFIHCDGTRWLVFANCGTATAIAGAAA